MTTHSSQAGLATLRAGVPVRIDSAAAKGMVPTTDEAAAMYTAIETNEALTTHDHLWAVRLLDQRMQHVRPDPKSQHAMHSMLTDMAVLVEAGHSDVALRMLHEWWELAGGSQ